MNTEEQINAVRLLMSHAQNAKSEVNDIYVFYLESIRKECDMLISKMYRDNEKEIEKKYEH